MKADETNLLEFLREPKQFVIPIYQRTYSWTKKECKQLFNDIKKVGNDNQTNAHFIGSIVYIQKGIYQVSSIPRPLVIDGQQRLTTVALLISALCKHVTEDNENRDIDSEKLKSYYLLNEREKDELRYKLYLTKSDKDTLFKIIDDKEINDGVSRNLIENYKFFKEKLKEVDLNTIYKGLSKLIII